MWDSLAAGIRLFNVSNGLVVDNKFDGNDVGISLKLSDFNTVVNNTFNSNSIGISLESSYYNIVVNNIFINSDWIDIDPIFYHPYFIPVVLLLVGLVGITSLGAKWRMARLIRKDREFEASTQREAPVDT